MQISPSKKLFKCALLCVATLCLASCSLFQFNDEAEPTAIYLEQDNPTWLAHLQQLTQITHYQAEGQLGYISEKERFSGQFLFNYRAERDFDLTFSSLLTKTTLTITRTPEHITISDNKGNHYTDSAVQETLKTLLGFDFPLDTLPLWLKGVPAESLQYRVNENALLADFEYILDDQLWQVEYPEYNEESEPKLPKSIQLKNADQTLKLKVKHWTLPTESIEKNNE